MKQILKTKNKKHITLLTTRQYYKKLKKRKQFFFRNFYYRSQLQRNEKIMKNKTFMLDKMRALDFFFRSNINKYNFLI